MHSKKKTCQDILYIEQIITLIVTWLNRHLYISLQDRLAITYENIFQFLS